MPNGSVYETGARHDRESAVQARLWCAHEPDPIAFAPPLIDIPSDQPVQLLSKEETREHLLHPGFVRTAFEHEMDRHHQEQMSLVYARRSQEDAAAVERAHAQRPWWRKWST
jgi:hypothetical protein